jgi:hypothetical protein
MLTCRTGYQLAALGSTLLMWGCASVPRVPAPIAAELRSREILAFEDQPLDGVPTLVLAYRASEPPLEAWPNIVKEVAQVSPHVRAEADRRQLGGIRIMVKVPNDVIVFDFRRSGAKGWKEVWRDLLEVRRLSSGRSIGLRSITEQNVGGRQSLDISYITTLNLSEQRVAVREEARAVLELYADKVDRIGAKKVIVSPYDRLRDGTSVGVVFVREDGSGVWKSES